MKQQQQIMDELKIINLEIEHYLDLNPVKKPENRKKVNQDALINSLSHLLEFFMLTPSEFSKESGINSPIIYGWLNKKGMPDLESIRRLSVYFQCTPAVFYDKNTSNRYCESLERKLEESGRNVKNKKFSYEKIKEILARKGLNTTDFKKMTGFECGVLKRWRTGVTSPRLSLIRLICEVLDVSPSEFMVEKLDDSYPKYEIYEIAYWFQWKAHSEHAETIDPDRIQIFCFYAQAWYYTLYNQKLMNSEFEARINGPFSEKLFNKIGIVNLYIELNKSSEKKVAQHSILNEKLNQDEDVSEFLELVWNTYKNLGDISLGVLVRTERPWMQARAKSDFDALHREPISLESMKEYYSTIMGEFAKELLAEKLKQKGEKHGNQNISQTGSQKCIITEHR